MSVAPDQMPKDDGLSSALEVQDQAATAQQLLEAWDLDILHQEFIRPGRARPHVRQRGRSLPVLGCF
jgi:hypothetical protein